MQKTTVSNGYMTLKVELFQTKIARTIIVPAYCREDFSHTTPENPHR